MIAFTKDTVPTISTAVDFVNIMTYDLMNRRDHVTKHHTGMELSMDAVDAYLENGLPPEKANLGFAFYVRWFKTNPHGGCERNPIGCQTTLMEDPTTGADLGQAGAFSWHDPVPPELSASFTHALAGGTYDHLGGGHYYWDPDEHIWWTWDPPAAMARKVPAIVRHGHLGGVFAWALGEDAPHWTHLNALTAAVQRWPGRRAPSPHHPAEEEKQEL
jgi:GH18 family chitinase